jgi:hypothetical protein
MSMEALTKTFESHGRDWYAGQRRYNTEHDVNTDVLGYFAWKARDEFGIGIESDRELERREAMFLRRFNVQDGEWNREKKVRQYAHDSWIIEKFWEEHGCPWGGPEAPTVEKAQQSGPLQSTFPVFIEAQIQAGRLADPILNLIVTDTVNVNAGSATHVELTDTASTPTGAVETMEGARTSQVKVTFRERNIPLLKFGYETLSTYEASRRARLPVLARAYERIGRRFQYILVEFALDVLILGDNSTVTLESGATATVSNAAGTEAADVAGTPDYDDMLDLLFSFTEGYNPNLGIASGAVLKNLLNVAEFKDSQLFTFARDGNFPALLGIPFRRWDSKGVSSGYTNTKLVLHDTSVGLTEYTDGGILTETDRIITEGWNRAVTTMWVAFAVNDAAGTWIGTDFAA